MFDKVQVVKLYKLIITFYIERTFLKIISHLKKHITSCVTASSTTTVLMKVASGRRPGLEKIPDDKPQECEQMITIMQRCWDQDPRDRLTSQVTLHLIADLFVL